MCCSARRWGLALLAVAVVLGGCNSTEGEASDETAGQTTSSVTVASEPTVGAPDTDERAGPESDVSQRRPLILDYSPTVSDVGALLYLLSRPELDVVAITLPVTGEAGCELGVEVTLGVLALLDRTVPIACDPDRPDDAGNWPSEFLEGHELLRSGLPAVAPRSAEGPVAHELISQAVAESDQPVTLVAVAPLTNVARALDRHPELIDRLDEIVIMGGAVDTPGNVADTSAEWNLWIDAPSAAQVFTSGATITLIPLDATNDVPVPPFWRRDLELTEPTEAIQYLGSQVETFPSVTSGFFYLWDELAAAVAAGEDTVTVGQMQLEVIDEPGPQYGSTVRAASGGQITVAVGVTDPRGFYDHFLATLAGAPVDRSSLPANLDLPPETVTSDSTAVEVVAYWLDHALMGNLDEAASVVAGDALWVGLGSSPDAFVAGSAPYEATDVEFACTLTSTVAWCNVQWTDRWIAAIPELEVGGLQVQAEVVDGQIVAFREFFFRRELTTAFDQHIAWLESEQPAALEEACATEAASKECSELLVATVDAWINSR